jgi:hypothetical protein
MRKPKLTLWDNLRSAADGLAMAAAGLREAAAIEERDHREAVRLFGPKARRRRKATRSRS